MSPYVALVLRSLLTAGGHLLVKRAGAAAGTAEPALFLRMLVRPGMIFGGACVLCAPPLYFFALTKLDLSSAYAFTALTYVLVSAGSRWLLGEHANAWHTTGVLLIAAGLVFWNL